MTKIERVGHEYVIDAVHRGVRVDGQRFSVWPLRKRVVPGEWLEICCNKACRRAEIAAQALPEETDRESVPVPGAYTSDRQRLA